MSRRAARIDDEFDAMVAAAFAAINQPYIHSVTYDANTKTMTAIHLPANFRPDNDATEWVYFLRAGDFVKIGYTTDLAGRLKRLQTGSPHELKLLMLQRGSKETERGFHRQFRPLQAHGEWFKLEGALLDYLNKQYERQKAGGVHP